MHIINARLRNQEGLHELHLEDGLIRSIGRQTERAAKAREAFSPPR